jgi:hypothetical protein
MLEIIQKLFLDKITPRNPRLGRSIYSVSVSFCVSFDPREFGRGCFFIIVAGTGYLSIRRSVTI